MATAILADANIEGHVSRLVSLAETGEWAQIWADLGIALEDFRRLGLAWNTPDRELWRLCQDRQIILLTANRNHDDPDSPEAVIREENAPHCLPVFTLADAERVVDDRAYAERVVVRMLDYLLDLDAYRGTGRLYLP